MRSNFSFVASGPEADFEQHFADHSQPVIDLLRRNDEWRCEAQDVAPGRDYQHTAFSAAVDDGATLTSRSATSGWPASIKA